MFRTVMFRSSLGVLKLVTGRSCSWSSSSFNEFVRESRLSMVPELFIEFAGMVPEFVVELQARF